MTRRILVLIRSDPEKTHRAGEGIRIALGLASGEHAVDVVLTDRAPLLLTPEIEGLVDGEMTEKFLAALKGFISPFYVDQESAGKIDLSESDYQTALLSREEMAEKIAAAESFFVF
ncbi:MAG: hypothetical protein EPO39_02265 [Candidatus Manganitrophaceae bacterium]|nr:MAG: hypothetical protein EPO39_02265 [Candidatus Manganitrophaceae bacterium]